MSVTFTISDTADAAAVAKYQAGLAKLKPACTRCGHTLAKRELDGGVCGDREVCRIRRSGGVASGFVALRKFAVEKAAKRAAAAAFVRESFEPPVEELAWRDGSKGRACVSNAARTRRPAARRRSKAQELVDFGLADDLADARAQLRDMGEAA